MPGCLIVKFEKPIDGFPGFRIDGNFDPDDAPIITRSMRSDDLGQIVYDILKSKGIDLKSDESS